MVLNKRGSKRRIKFRCITFSLCNQFSRIEEHIHEIVQIFLIHSISIGSHSRFFDVLKCKTNLDNCINSIDAFYDIGRHGNLAQGVHG